MLAMNKQGSRTSRQRLRSSSPQHIIDATNGSPSRQIRQRNVVAVPACTTDPRRAVEEPSARSLPLSMLEREIAHEDWQSCFEVAPRQRLSSFRLRQLEHQVDDDDSDSDNDMMTGNYSSGAHQERWKTRLLNKKLRNRALGMRRSGGPPVDLISCHKLARDSDNESSSTTASGSSTDASIDSEKVSRTEGNLEDDLDVRLSLRSKIVVALSVLYGMGMYCTFLTGSGIFASN